jgi:hypothetical protein
MSKVYVINKAAHDFTAAKEYGQLVFLSSRPINRYATNKMFRIFNETLRLSESDDYILITSLTIMNIIACSLFVLRHEKLNLLIHQPSTNNYIERRMDFTDLATGE